VTETERLKANLDQMGLKRMAGTFETEAERAAQLKTSYSATWDGWSKKNCWPRPSDRSTTDSRRPTFHA